MPHESGAHLAVKYLTALSALPVGWPHCLEVLVCIGVLVCILPETACCGLDAQILLFDGQILCSRRKDLDWRACQQSPTGAVCETAYNA